MRILPGLLAASLLCGLARADDEGVVLVRVAPGLAAERAGLRPGDHLQRWRQGDARGDLASPFDLAEVEVERGPRGPVEVSGRRGDENVVVSLFPDDWGLEARPALPAETAAAFDAARALADSGREEEGRTALRDLAERQQGPDRVAWAWLELARAETRARRYDAAEASIRKALAAAPGAAPASREALLWAAPRQPARAGGPNGAGAGRSSRGQDHPRADRSGRRGHGCRGGLSGAAGAVAREEPRGRAEGAASRRGAPRIGGAPEPRPGQRAARLRLDAGVARRRPRGLRPLAGARRRADPRRAGGGARPLRPGQHGRRTGGPREDAPPGRGHPRADHARQHRAGIGLQRARAARCASWGTARRERSGTSGRWPSSSAWRPRRNGTR